jgi:hypothetical protein
MTMHMIRGMTSLNTKHRKIKKKAGWKQAQEEHEKFLNIMGIGKKGKSNVKTTKVSQESGSPYQRIQRQVSSYGELVGNGTASQRPTYTGTEIVGIATMHKSNAVPIRRGTSEAIEIANMAK